MKNSVKKLIPIAAAVITTVALGFATDWWYPAVLFSDTQITVWRWVYWVFIAARVILPGAITFFAVAITVNKYVEKKKNG